MSDEFAHRLPLNQIRDGERIELRADEGERTKVAERLGLRFPRPAGGACDPRAQGRDRPRARTAEGRPRPELRRHRRTRSKPMPTSPSTSISFPSPQPVSSDEEVELIESDCDVVFHDGSAIDLGSAIADTLALSLDPYPRSAGAEAVLKEAGVLSEAEAGPFAALAKLKRSDRQLLERNVVVEVGVECCRLRALLALRAAAAASPEVVAVTAAAEAAARSAAFTAGVEQH